MLIVLFRSLAVSQDGKTNKHNDRNNQTTHICVFIAPVKQKQRLEPMSRPQPLSSETIPWVFRQAGGSGRHYPLLNGRLSPDRRSGCGVAEQVRNENEATEDLRRHCSVDVFIWQGRVVGTQWEWFGVWGEFGSWVEVYLFALFGGVRRRVERHGEAVVGAALDA